MAHRQRKRVRGRFTREQLVALYVVGIPVTQIAELDGTDRNTVHHHLRRLSAERRFGPRDDVDAAWLAGLIDGEGCISIGGPTLKANRRYVSLQVAMTDRPVLEHVRDVVNCGAVYHRRATSKNRMDVWCFIVAGRRVVEILQRCLPYLWVKRRQAELVVSIGHILTSEEQRQLKSFNLNKGFAVVRAVA